MTSLPGETGKDAARRETQEETGLNIVRNQFKYIRNDPEFNCDMFIVKLTDEEIPARTEPEKMSSWLFYPWNTFFRMASEKRTTPSLTKYRELIWSETLV